MKENREKHVNYTLIKKPKVKAKLIDIDQQKRHKLREPSSRCKTNTNTVSLIDVNGDKISSAKLMQKKNYISRCKIGQTKVAVAHCTQFQEKRQKCP